MPPRLKRYQHEGHLHFITFRCYRRLPYLDDDHARICFEEILELCRQRHRRVPHLCANFIAHEWGLTQLARTPSPCICSQVPEGHGFSRATNYPTKTPTALPTAGVKRGATTELLSGAEPLPFQEDFWT